MSVNVNGSYSFYGHENPDLLAQMLQTQLDNIGIVLNNANAGLTVWDNVKTKVLTVTTSTVISAGDVTTSGAGNGLVVTTPDGTKTFRIYVDNNGVVNSLELT